MAEVINFRSFTKSIVCQMSTYSLQHPHGDNLLTVVDYMRHHGNCRSELVVPVYPERGDMVLIQGKYNGDIWHGHIQSVDFVNLTVDVFFFISSMTLRHYNAYVRESHSRRARNVVAWEPIIGIAEGHWRSASTWVKAD